MKIELDSELQLGWFADIRTRENGHLSLNVMLH